MTEEKSSQAVGGDADKVNAVVQMLPLPPGIFMFSVAANTAPPLAGFAGLKLPSIHVALGPDVQGGQVELLQGADTFGHWLHSPGNILVAKINAPGATLVLTSVRSEAAKPLSIKIERIDAALGVAQEADSGIAEAALTPIPKPVREGLRMRVNAHVRSRGDLSFVDTEWAGRVEAGLWLEAFSVVPLEQLGGNDIEYKGLTSSGFETPWLSGGASCGTRGMSVPLVGFAIRPKAGSAAAGAYDCEYSGYFQSGVVVGPLRNGTPCRSTQVNDPLEGIMIKILERKGLAAKPVGGFAANESPVAAPKARVVGPSFSKLREDAAVASAAKQPARNVKTPVPVKAKPKK